MRFLFILLLIYSIVEVQSETLILKDGTVIKMTLKTQDVDTLTYTLKGKEFKVPKNKVRRVVYAKTPDIEEKITKEELQKLKQEKSAKKTLKTQEEEMEETRLLEEEIAKAIEEQKKQELLNLSFGERIQKLESELSDLKAGGEKGSSTKLATFEKDLDELKKRTRRMERYLDIDPDIEDYYAKPRSMWSLVWRSALIPGWGLSYGRDEGFGTAYTTLFFIAGLGGLGYKSALNDLDNSLNEKFINDFIVKPYALSILRDGAISNSSSTTEIANITNNLTTYQTYESTIKFVKYLQSRDTFNQQVENSEKLIAFAVGLYAVQLIHTAIYGYFWAKRIPRNFSEEKSAGWKIQVSPLARRNPLTNTQDYQMELGYRFEF
ncbi:MAG: hypothetical protein KBF93_15815 [Leptospiraceae bacterium]|nr:hypothetical protein [Leptospiraceae bacterium]